MAAIKNFTDQLNKYSQQRKELEAQIKDSYAKEMIESIKALTTNTKMLTIYEKNEDSKIKKALIYTINSRQFVTSMKKALKEQNTSNTTEDHSVNATVAKSDTENTPLHDESIEITNENTSNAFDDNINLNRSYCTTDTDNY